MSDFEMAAKAVEWLWDSVTEGFSSDPWDIQDFMKHIGLLTTIPYDPDKHGREFEGAEDMNPGDDFYVPTDAAKRLLVIARAAAATRPNDQAQTELADPSGREANAEDNSK